ncbi:TetR family transcriptional regulator [Rugosimonospora acidiphila]|uniref:TetR family transcriptional regulator n=1 Tax=Rugosimonospora acidiphila TaxID=556531 RepID=A0ABP9SEI8_9ACTN
MDTEASERTGLRERKKQATRAALSWAAIRLAAERGVDNVRVEDIAAEANVSLRTFRNYFANKAEAIVARHLDRALRVADELRARPAEEPLWDAIANAVPVQFAPERQEGGPGRTAGGEHPRGQNWAEGILLMLGEPTVQGEFHKANAAAQDELARAIAERTGTDAAHDLYPQLVAAAVGAAIGVAMNHWLRTDPPAAIAPLMRDLLTQLAAGLPVP